MSASAIPTATPDAAPRDRFLGFAFAAADLLLETAPDGIIRFAAGAFRARFGRDSQSFLGRPLASLIASGDHAVLAMALATVTQRGRLPPLVLRLADAGQTQATLACMLMPGPPRRLCFTIGPVPLPPALPDQAMPGTQAFLREAEAALHAGTDRSLGLLEVQGWQAAQGALSPEDQRALRDNIGAVLTDAGAGTTAGELAEGRYGVLGPGEMELGALVERLERLLRTGPAARHTRVAEAGLLLSRGELGPAQAARALRYAVSRFAEGGAEAVAALGLAGGLAGIITQAELRARAMREAIAAHRFRLAYQPVVALADLRVHHYEALLRPIPTPGSPAQSTQDFVIFAEAVGLSEDLDWAVLNEALAALRSSPAPLAVNISGLSLQSPAFRERLLEHLASQSALIAPPSGTGRLLIELTETAEIEDMSGAAAAITRLRAAGVAVCLDDFGAGAAAFRYLSEFRVDYVKIDGAYVRAAPHGARERGFIASMVELAHGVGAHIVAEMIETDEQARLMRELGVEFGQGWLFGRPGALPGGRR